MDVSGSYPVEWAFAIEEHRKELLRFYNIWNETELLSKFIGPFLTTIKLRGRNYNFFLERQMRAKIGDFPVLGIVDGVVATGSYEPQKPYFFFHEYKRMKQTDADPLGQLLIEMLAGQTLNDDGLVIYGCYVIGTYWRFVILMDKVYSQSQGFDATDPDELLKIWLIIDKAKKIIETRSETPIVP